VARVMDGVELDGKGGGGPGRMASLLWLCTMSNAELQGQ